MSRLLLSTAIAVAVFTTVSLMRPSSSELPLPVAEPVLEQPTEPVPGALAPPLEEVSEVSASIPPTEVSQTEEQLSEGLVTWDSLTPTQQSKFRKHAVLYRLEDQSIAAIYVAGDSPLSEESRELLEDFLVTCIECDSELDGYFDRRFQGERITQETYMKSDPKLAVLWEFREELKQQLTQAGLGGISAEIPVPYLTRAYGKNSR